jgi:hypothetical protein
VPQRLSFFYKKHNGVETAVTMVGRDEAEIDRAPRAGGSAAGGVSAISKPINIGNILAQTAVIAIVAALPWHERWPQGEQTK